MVQKYTLLIITSIAVAVLFGMTLFIDHSLDGETLITGSAVQTYGADPFTQGASLGGLALLIFGALAMILAVTAVLLSKKQKRAKFETKKSRR